MARSLHQIQLLGSPIAINIEAPTRFHAGERAYRAFGDLLFARDRPRNRLFIVLAGLQVPHRASRLWHAFERRFPDSPADLVDMRPESGHRHLVGPQIPLHAKRVGDLAQRSPKNQPVETAERTCYRRSVLCYKLGPASLLLSECFWIIHNDTALRGTLPFLVAATGRARFICGQQGSFSILLRRYVQ